MVMPPAVKGSRRIRELVWSLACMQVSEGRSFVLPEIKVDSVGLILRSGAAAERIEAIVVCGKTTIWVEALSVETVRDKLW